MSETEYVPNGAYIEKLEAALRNCDAWLDENSCGACFVPPTAGVLDVPEAVRKAVDKLYIAIGREQAARRVLWDKYIHALTLLQTAVQAYEATSLDITSQQFVVEARELIKDLDKGKRCPERESNGVQCELKQGHEGSHDCSKALAKWRSAVV